MVMKHMTHLLVSVTVNLIGQKVRTVNTLALAQRSAQTTMVWTLMDVLAPRQLTALSARRTRIVIPTQEDVFATSTGRDQTVLPGLALAIQNVTAAMDQLQPTAWIEMVVLRHVSLMQLL